MRVCNLILAPLVLALCALLAAPDAHAEQGLSCLDANNQLWPASPSHPCPVGGGAIPIPASSQYLALTTATLLSPPAVAPTAGGASYALLTIETNAVRFRCDGTAPTSTVGSLIAAGTQGVVVPAAMFATCKFIQSGGGVGTMDVEYFRQ